MIENDQSYISLLLRLTTMRSNIQTNFIPLEVVNESENFPSIKNVTELRLLSLLLSFELNYVCQVLYSKR